ncbi:MAG: O-antigen ligase family protein [Myxococcota bacterium]|nr:O-antigen ligase family protein [Myxococcota bacterium]
MNTPSTPIATTGPDEPPSLDFYHFVGMGWLVYWMTNSYRWIADVAPFLDFYVVTGAFLTYFTMVRPTQVINMISRPALWLLSLTAIVPILLYFTASERSAYTYLEIRTRIVTFALIAGSALVMAHKDGPWLLRRSALISLFIAIFVNFAEHFIENPYNRTLAGTRSAGFYADPNVAGAAIGTLLLLGLPIRKQTMKSVMIASLAYVAILATLSRSGMLFATILIAAYIFLPRGPQSLPASTRAAVSFGGLGAALVMATAAIFLFNLKDLEVWRLTSAFTLDTSDASAQSRVDFAAFAFDRFLDYFWTGRGPGSAKEYHVSAHNTYITLGYDYGIIGILAYMALIGWGAFKVFRYGWNRTTTYFFLSFQVAYYSMFAHDVHENALFAVMFASFLTNASLDEPAQRPRQLSPKPGPQTSDTWNSAEPAARS